MDAIDRAIATPARRVAGSITLPSGALVRLEMPVGLARTDVIDRMVRIPVLVAQSNQQQAAGHIALPSGGLIPVPKES